MKLFLLLIAAFVVVSCSPRREFVRFEDAGTFRPGPGHGDRRVGPPDGEYDSYELIDNGAPSQGIAPMYEGYPQVVETYDPYGNPQRVIIPNPW